MGKNNRNNQTETTSMTETTATMETVTMPTREELQERLNAALSAPPSVFIRKGKELIFRQASDPDKRLAIVSDAEKAVEPFVDEIKRFGKAKRALIRSINHLAGQSEQELSELQKSHRRLVEHVETVRALRADIDKTTC